jgi:purine nucleoside permease
MVFTLGTLRRNGAGAYWAEDEARLSVLRRKAKVVGAIDFRRAVVMLSPAMKAIRSIQSAPRANVSVRRAGTGFAVASRTLKFIQEPRSSAKDV